MMEDLPPTQRDALRAADLAARVRHGNMDDVATNVIDVCNGVDVESRC